MTHELNLTIFSLREILKSDICEFQSITDCVRGKIYFKEIVSNTKLDLYHSSFIHLVREFLIIFVDFFLYIQYLFIGFVYHIYWFFFFFFLIIKSVYCSFLIYHKSKILKYINNFKADLVFHNLFL